MRIRAGLRQSSSPPECCQEAAGDLFGHHGWDRVADLRPLVGRRATKRIPIMERLQPRGLAWRDASSLCRVDVSISILSQVRDDRFRGPVTAKAEILVVEHVPAIAH